MRADEGYVTELLASGTALALDRGLALTEDEVKELELDARAAFAHAAASSVIAYARSLPTFAGVYIDQPAGGEVVILLTEVTSAVVAELQAREPSPSRGIRIEQARYSQVALRQAATTAWTVWSDLADNRELFSVAVDVPGNRIRLEIEGPAANLDAGLEAELAHILGVPVVIAGGERHEPTAQTCTSRHRCYDPTEAGTFIAQNTSAGTRYCAMGFHITIGTNEQFLTSGHCGFDTNTYWYQLYGPGFGNEAGTLFANYGDDVMKVEFPDAQASDWIYAAPSTLHAGGYRAPIYGEYICASLPKQTNLDCGTVADDFLSYTLSGAWGTYVLYGGSAAGMTAVTGDSGGPVYAPIGSQAVALGVMSSTGEAFGLLSETMPIWGATVY